MRRFIEEVRPELLRELTEKHQALQRASADAAASEAALKKAVGDLHPPGWWEKKYPRTEAQQSPAALADLQLRTERKCDLEASRDRLSVAVRYLCMAKWDLHDAVERVALLSLTHDEAWMAPDDRKRLLQHNLVAATQVIEAAATQENELQKLIAEHPPVKFPYTSAIGAEFDRVFSWLLDKEIVTKKLAALNITNYNLHSSFALNEGFFRVILSPIEQPK